MQSLMRRMLRTAMTAAVAAALHAAAASDAFASAAAAHAERCERAIRHGAALVGIPERVLHAVALTESGRWEGGRLRPWPWAVNREGEGFWFDTREQALDFARRSLIEGRPSFDLGCFQINYHWHGHNFFSLDAMIDPDQGAAYAARFLQELYGEFGDWSLAAGAYHSRTPEHALRYRARFDSILADLSGQGFLPATEPMAASESAAPSPVRRVRGPLIITVGPGASEAVDDDGIVIHRGIIKVDRDAF